MFRFYREDFGELPVRVIHMDLIFDVFADHTRVTSDLHGESRDSPLAAVTLSAKNLEIITVKCPEFGCTHAYDEGRSSLTVTFGVAVPPGTRFTIHTETICRPTDHILEGLYYDKTPPGAPPQQITQCQQWGFQRLVPCFDDMTAKCTYITTIIADERYSNLITNGDIISPRQPAAPGRVKITFGNTVTPMAPYLFFLGCGTYETSRRECEYPDGRQFMLELLALPGSDPAIAEQALDILHDAVLWVHLYTGPGRYDELSARDRIYLQMRGMERIKKRSPQSPRLAAIRSELANMIGSITPGYAYTGSAYREIAMQNSDFGGMENVGNTTITANRIMPHPAMTDPAYEYLVRVKAHEYYHNLNGSEVTGWSPFEIWLNEAVTVHVENEYHAFHFGEDYSRLQTVLSLIMPGSGTLDLDSGAASLPIEPEGFNDPNELITGITYVKAPEFVRMVETLMGKEAFVKGLDLYHRRYRHGNATRQQWVQAMEETAGQPFAPMAEGWLRQTGFPTLSVSASFSPDRTVTTLTLRQEGDQPHKRWIFPVRIAVADSAGNDMAEVVHRMENEQDTLEIRTAEPPGFLSLNRGYSFYGKVRYDPPPAELYLQAEKDSDLVSRCIALLAIMDREKLRMLADPQALPDPAAIDLWYRLFSDRDMMMDAGAQVLTIPESVPDKRYTHRYQALYEVRERILHSIAEKNTSDLLDTYQSVHVPAPGREILGLEQLAIKRRQIKNTALSVLSRLDTPDVHQLIRDQFTGGSGATDTLVAFSLYMDSSAADRDTLLGSFEEDARKDPVLWENFLSAIAANSSQDALALIGRVEQSPAFRIEQANDQRALYGRFALNRKLSLQTGKGRAFLAGALEKLAPINEHSTVAMLRVLGPLDDMEEADQVPLVGILAALLGKLDPEKTPSVSNTARRILAGAPRAVKRYEEQEGSLHLRP